MCSFVAPPSSSMGTTSWLKRLGRQVALNHEFREMPIFRVLGDQVGRPEVGDLVFVQI